MATNYCRYCGARIASNAVHCPSCGRKLKNKNEPYKRPRSNSNKKKKQDNDITKMLIIFLVIFVLCITLGFGLVMRDTGIVKRESTPAPTFTAKVTEEPTEELTEEPSEEPTEEATKNPTATPTKKPSGNKTYSNGRYGFSVKYPTDVLSQSAQAGNSDGITLTGKNITATVSGSNNVFHESLDELYADAQARGGVSYKTKKSNYFIVSGTNGNTIYYTKTYVGTESINTLTIEYPTSMKKQYDSAVTTMANSFTPGDLSSAH